MIAHQREHIFEGVAYDYNTYMAFGVGSLKPNQSVRRIRQTRLQYSFGRVPVSLYTNDYTPNSTAQKVGSYFNEFKINSTHLKGVK